MQQTLTSRACLALTALIDLASLSRSGPVALTALCARQDISRSYLEQLFGKLRHHGLVQTTRGPGGGYSLGRNAADISVADVLIAIDMRGEPRTGDPKASRRIDRDGYPFTDDVWAGVNQKLIECLATVSLQSLVDQQPGELEPAVPAPIIKRGVMPRPVVLPFKASGPNSVFALGHAFSSRHQDEAAARVELSPAAPPRRRASRTQCA